ncbi:AAA family ATPase [Amycolatopsis pretoriensis]|uniref:AAA family ATPase n=1 Tax=Amycolatopsis pretoriensis TaxID=218821 RepID=UPI0013024143|nr:AAA family ATPase [Amycolatopsis pretoriensis]
MLEAIGAATTPLVLVTGFAGTGRTALLTDLADIFARRGATVWGMRFTTGGEPVPAQFGTATYPGDTAGSGTTDQVVPAGRPQVLALPGSDGSPWPWTPIRPVDGAGHDPHVARRAAAAVAAPLLRSGGETVLLVDDVQWIDLDSLAVLAALVRRLAGTRTRCVCTARIPTRTAAAEFPATLRALRAEGLAQTFRLSPWPRQKVAREVAAVLRASPESALIEQVFSVSRGVPAAVRDTIGMLRREGRAQVVDRRAYLTLGGHPTEGPEAGRLVLRIRELGPTTYSVAKAVAVFAPLGSAVPWLVEKALDLPPRDVLEALDSLSASGVLHRGRRGASWRFSIPLVAAALEASLGPLERRSLAAAAVSAVWSGAARCADDDHLANQIANAGALVDRERALGELLTRAAAARPERLGLVLRWLAAASELSTDRSRRAMVLLLHTASCHQYGDHESSLRGARALLDEYADHLGPDAAQEVQLIATQAMFCLGDVAALHALAGAQQSWAGRSEDHVVARAAAAALLDQWATARDLLAAGSGQWRSGNPTSAMHGELLAALADLWGGRLDRFEASLASRALWLLRGTSRHRLDQVRSHVTALLVIGDPDRAEELLSAEHLTTDDLPLHAQSALAALRGRPGQAVDLTRRSLAVEQHRHDPGHAGMVHATITLLVLQGRLASARELLRLARARPCVFTQLVDIAETRLDRALGDNGRAVARLTGTVQAIVERGLVAGAELCWAELADLALERGDYTAAWSARDALTELAATMPTARVVLHASLVRATVDRDQDAALECLELARRRAQPLELAVVLERLVRHGAAEPESLTEAYELLGGLDALLARAWLRNLMREHSVAVRGRTNTVIENERLLALLAADGLTNKQLATALRVSEKSIEGRLSRLFTRSGHRSRIELATAVLNGELSRWA